jgi:hypothetical protein
MNFQDLLDDAQEEAGDAAAALRVCLATRTVDGVEAPPNQVLVMNIAMIRVDDENREVGFIAVDPDATGDDTFTIAAAMHMLDERPEIADFELICLKEHRHLPDGTDAEMVCAIGGSLTHHGEELWLLLEPMSQWLPPEALN